MATTVKRVEKKIKVCERFRVKFLHNRDWRDVRSDRHGLPGWRFKRAAKNGLSVSEWKQQRFRPVYPGYSVEVLLGNGRPAHGRTNLGTVRETYP